MTVLVKDENVLNIIKHTQPLNITKWFPTEICKLMSRRFTYRVEFVGLSLPVLKTDEFSEVW